MNLYSYANQNPIMFTDPLGLAAEGILPGIGSGAGTSAGLGAGIGEVLGILGACARAVTVIGGALFPTGISQCQDFPKPDACNDDDYDDPCDDLLLALKVRFVQMLQRAMQGIDVKFEILQYEAARTEFCKVCPAMCIQAPRIPDELKR